MEEQFLYWMDFTLYEYIWNKKKLKNTKILTFPFSNMRLRVSTGICFSNRFI